VKYVCIEKNCGQFQVTMMCRLLDVSRSGFYAWRRRPDSQRTIRHRRLVVKIKAIFVKHRQSYGSPRILRDLRAGGETVRLGQVVRLMRENDLRAKQKRKFKSHH